MSECKPDGEDMSFSVFQDAIQFSLERAYPLPIMLSGGEPTEHPDFLHFVDYAIEQVQKKAEHSW